MNRVYTIGCSSRASTGAPYAVILPGRLYRTACFDEIGRILYRYTGVSTGSAGCHDGPR